MKNSNTLAAMLSLAAMGITTSALADTPRMTEMKTHPSQGEVSVVEGSLARQLTYENGMFVNVDTSGLTPGNVHTLWFVAINNPAGCFDPSAVEAKKKANAEDCNSFDVLKRTDIVDSDVGYGGGLIVGADGKASFSWHQPTGALTNAWFGNGLKSSEQAEIHLVINDHGPAIDGRVADMLATYRDGCSDDSIPAPMPDTARADGKAGPNSCRLVQFTVIKASNQSS